MLCTLLIDGGDAGARAHDGNSSVTLTASQGRVSIVDAPLAAGTNLDAASNDGDTPLMCAIIEGHLTTVMMELLLASGADLNIRNIKGDTPSPRCR